MRDGCMTVNNSASLIEGRLEFRAAVLGELALLAAQEASPITRELIWVDEDFNDWPLDDEQLQVHLTAFLRRPGRRLRVIAHQFGPMVQRHPRFVKWRKSWSHALDAWAFPAPGVLTRMLLSSTVVVEVHDLERNLGWTRRGSVGASQALERVADWQSRCEPG